MFDALSVCGLRLRGEVVSDCSPALNLVEVVLFQCNERFKCIEISCLLFSISFCLTYHTKLLQDHPKSHLKLTPVDQLKIKVQASVI